MAGVMKSSQRASIAVIALFHKLYECQGALLPDDRRHATSIYYMRFTYMNWRKNNG